MCPNGFLRRASPGRLRESVAWQRDTLQPLHGLSLGLDYTFVQGVLEIDDSAHLFANRMVTPRDASGVSSGTPIYALPLHGYNLWNTRYLIVPLTEYGWLGEKQGFERLYPPPEVVRDAARAKRWAVEEDWQLLRNRDAFPRAWLVYTGRIRRTVSGRDDPEYVELMKDLVYQSDPRWSEPGRPVYNLRTMAFVETDQPDHLRSFIARASVTPAGSVVVTRHEPQRVELVATLERPGLVVLADTFYPGWHLTIDGAPAPIYRTNRMMRGAAVRAGRHILVYTYDPASFRVGGALSLAGLLALTILAPCAARGPNAPPGRASGPPQAQPGINRLCEAG